MKTAENKVNHVGLNCAPRIYRNPATLRPVLRVRVSVNELLLPPLRRGSRKMVGEIVARPSTPPLRRSTTSNEDHQDY